MRNILALFLFLLLGCAEVPNLEDSLNNSSMHPRVPIVTRLSYSVQSINTSLSAPFASSIVLYPDSQTGICSDIANTAELTLEGTFDETRTQSIEVVGITNQNFVLSGDQFTLRFCAATGSSVIRITATAANQKKSDPVEFSLSLTPALGTIGFGLAKYPSPGFRVEALGPSLTSLTSGSWTAQSLTMSAINTNQTSGAWNLSVGFTPVLKEVHP